jgi:hypothetical protein
MSGGTASGSHAEVVRWQAMSCEEVVSRLRDEVEIGTKKYQVEVELLDNTASHLQSNHVGGNFLVTVARASVLPVPSCASTVHW